MRWIKTSFDSPAETGQEQRPLLLLAGLLSFLVAVVPGLGLLSYPFRLLITIVHELSHGLAALLTGGSFLNFVIYPNGAGLAYTAGGWRWVVIPAGYLGAALFAALLITLSHRPRRSRLTFKVMGGALLLLTLRYALPSLLSQQWAAGLLSLVVGLVLGGLCLWIAMRAPQSLIVFLLNLIAIQAGLLAFSDAVGLIGITTSFFSGGANDAESMARLTLIPAPVWAVLWAAITLALILGALWREIGRRT